MSNFTKGSIEFLTVAAETCKFLESQQNNKNQFITTLRKLLPLLYLKTAVTDIPSEQIYMDEPEHFVTENDYNYIKQKIAELLGNDDVYLTTVHNDMKYSDTPIAANISEDLADIYQSLKDFTSCSQLNNENLLNDALLICLNDFKTYWGGKLLNAELALHAIWSNDVMIQNDDINNF